MKKSIFHYGYCNEQRRNNEKILIIEFLCLFYKIPISIIYDAVHGIILSIKYVLDSEIRAVRKRDKLYRKALKKHLYKDSERIIDQDDYCFERQFKRNFAWHLTKHDLNTYRKPRR